jgi:dTMP kinase
VGLLVAIEGIDGSGKGTQAQRLLERLRATNVRATLMSFPRYDATFFGRAVADFLNGRFGTLDQVHPFLASLLFALDRFESLAALKDALASHDVVVLDRYVASNCAHQAAKLDGPARHDLRRSIEHVEHSVFQMPRADLVVLLDLSVPAARQLVAQKSPRAYTDREADIQEADADYLERVRALYLEMAAGDPTWSVVRCDAANGLRSIDDVAEDVGRVVAARLS